MLNVGVYVSVSESGTERQDEWRPHLLLFVNFIFDHLWKSMWKLGKCNYDVYVFITIHLYVHISLNPQLPPNEKCKVWTKLVKENG